MGVTGLQNLNFKRDTGISEGCELRSVKALGTADEASCARLCAVVSWSQSQALRSCIREAFGR